MFRSQISITTSTTTSVTNVGLGHKCRHGQLRRSEDRPHMSAMAANVGLGAPAERICPSETAALGGHAERICQTYRAKLLLWTALLSRSVGPTERICCSGRPC